jgi:hypothetical protein
MALGLRAGRRVGLAAAGAQVPFAGSQVALFGLLLLVASAQPDFSNDHQLQVRTARAARVAGRPLFKRPPPGLLQQLRPLPCPVGPTTTPQPTPRPASRVPRPASRVSRPAHHSRSSNSTPPPRPRPPHPPTTHPPTRLAVCAQTFKGHACPAGTWRDMQRVFGPSECKQCPSDRPLSVAGAAVAATDCVDVNTALGQPAEGFARQICPLDWTTWHDKKGEEGENRCLIVQHLPGAASLSYADAQRGCAALSLTWQGVSLTPQLLTFRSVSITPVCARMSVWVGVRGWV